MRIPDSEDAAAKSLRRLEESRAFEYFPNLRRVRAFVRENLQIPISLGDAATAARLERRYFSTYFHQRVGICFWDWLAAVRIRRAVELIQRRDCTLSWVSDQVGFGHQRTFQRAFKKWTGVTAKEFRESIRRDTQPKLSSESSGEVATWPDFP